MSTRVNAAIEEAKRIRARLLRRVPDYYLKWPGEGKDLAGACGVASFALAAFLGDPRTLRGVTGHSSGHVWNEVDGTTIDITGTQFNVLFPTPPFRGVVVAGVPSPWAFHWTDLQLQGLVALEMCRRWYETPEGTYDGTRHPWADTWDSLRRRWAPRTESWLIREAA